MEPKVAEAGAVRAGGGTHMRFKSAENSTCSVAAESGKRKHEPELGQARARKGLNHAQA